MKKPIAIDKLRAHLDAHGLTQRDFAVSIDVSGANLSQILSCRNSPSPRTIVAIEDATQGAIVLRDWVKVGALPIERPDYRLPVGRFTPDELLPAQREKLTQLAEKWECETLAEAVVEILREALDSDFCGDLG